MDLSQKLKDNLKKQKELEKKDEYLNNLQLYSGDDRVLPFTEIIKEIDLEVRSGVVVNSKIPKLDEMTSGFRPGQLITISGPTGQGKTTLLTTFIKSFAEQNINCLWLSFENSPKENEQKFNGEIPVFYAPRQMRESSLDWLKMRTLEGIAKFGTNVIMIDHLHYLLDMKLSSSNKSVNTSLLVGMIMRELKKFAVATETIIFLVSHLKNIDVLTQTPSVSDLRDSSFIGQESDTVMIMWRKRERDRNSVLGYRELDQSILIVDKNRLTGKKGYVKLNYINGEFIEDYAITQGED